ncbi:hypothetical protein ACKVWC_003810 [Pyricularia oryzae]
MATMPTNGNVNHQDQNAASASSRSQSNTESSSLSKDEVGWYFVEQYYTTLSKNPERLHLFYGKHSQLVYGLEAEVANVSVGRQQIQERIKSLDLQDCKVRVSNVDSQASEESIVIQVIGETVNKGGEPKKFVQTFILAKQPSGYFVLNDILRYINDDAEEDAAETAAAEEEAAAPETQAAAEPEAAKVEPEAAKPEAEAAEVDAAVSKDSEKTAESKEAPAAEAASAQPATQKDAVATPAKAESAAATPDPEKVAEEIAEEEVKKPELPKDPSPTPVAPRPAAPAAAEPEKAKEPPKPMTWASRAAAAARPAVALPKPAVPAAAPAPRPAAAAPAATPAAAAPAAAAPKPAAPAPAAEAPAAQESGSEWQTAGADSKRQKGSQSVVGAPQEDKGTLGYVKFVTEKVKTENLKTHLSSFGELVYFDINRTKNCAFVEFANIAGYTAAAAANPHTVDGEQIYVEPRRPKASAYGGSNYSNRGGSVPGRGRGGFDGNRSGSQGGRGSYGNQGRGGRGGAPRGRGGVSQPTNA